MTEEQTAENPQEAIPATPGEALTAGESTTFSAVSVSPDPDATVKANIAPEIPISWKDELKEIVELSEDELERIYTWLKSKV